MSKKRILVVDDEEDIVELVRYNLERDGYDVLGASSGEDGVLLATEYAPDLLIVDVMLPGMNGLDVCRSIKSTPKLSHIPIIMLSARGEETDVVSGLELGADDYVPKPFSPRVLLARVRAVLRRPKAGSACLEHSAKIRIEELTIDPLRHEVRLRELPLDLTATEFRILQLLVSKQGCVYTRYQIIKEVHGSDYPVTDRSVDVQITGVRRKLGDYGDRLETVRGVGYRFRDSGNCS